MAEAWNSGLEIKGEASYNWPEGWCEDGLLWRYNAGSVQEPYDVAIVGSGVVGCALAYLLSQYKLRVLLIDRNHDVGEGTSKGNSAIVHTGFDATPGTLESRLVTRASRLWPDLSRRLKIPFKTPSALLLAVDEEQKQLLSRMYDRSLANGVDDIEILSGDEAKELERNVTPEVRGALLVKRESIVDPFTTCVAYAEVALLNGTDVVLGLDVVAVSTSANGLKTILGREGQELRAKYVINAAGLGSTALAQTYQGRKFDTNPRRGQFFIYDKLAFGQLNHILLPVPTEKTKGILITPTIFGNVIVGPTAEDLPSEDAFSWETTSAGLAAVQKGASRLYPGLSNEPAIASYAGLRCNCAQGSYQINFNDGREGIVTLTGIRSTGLTSSIALAEYVIQGLADHCGMDLAADTAAENSRPEEAWPEWASPRPYEVEKKLKHHPDYARLVCHCEHISKQEIINALDSPLHPRTIDAIKRRTRTTSGRCQGGYCGTHIAEIISHHCGIGLDKITKKGPGSEILPPVS